MMCHPVGVKRVGRTLRVSRKTNSLIVYSLITFSPSSASIKPVVRSNLIWPDLFRFGPPCLRASSEAGRALHSFRATQGG
jgi:hypothetical protein